jgi:hypothetical protein
MKLEIKMRKEKRRSLCFERKAQDDYNGGN